MGNIIFKKVKKENKQWSFITMIKGTINFIISLGYVSSFEDIGAVCYLDVESAELIKGFPQDGDDGISFSVSE